MLSASQRQQCGLNGNHNSAINNLLKLRKAVIKKIKHGFQFPFRLELMCKAPHAMVSPYDIATETTCDEFGNVVPKNEIFNDQ